MKSERNSELVIQQLRLQVGRWQDVPLSVPVLSRDSARSVMVKLRGDFGQFHFRVIRRTVTEKELERLPLTSP